MVHNTIKQNTVLRGYETDFRGEIKPSFILGLMQEIAGDHAQEMGLGFDDMRKRGYIWVLSKIYAEIARRPKFGEAVEVTTWPLAPGKAICDRHFLIRSGNEVCIRAVSRWCILKMGSFRIAPQSLFPSLIEQYSDEKGVDYDNWQIPPLVEEAEPAFTVRLANADYDQNRHVNNIRYADYVFDCFSVEELERLQLKSFQMNYLKQCYEGDVLHLYRREAEPGVFIVEGRKGTEVVVAARICFAEQK